MTVKEALAKEIVRHVRALPYIDPVEQVDLYNKVLDNLHTLLYIPSWDEETVTDKGGPEPEEPYVSEPTPFSEPSAEEYSAPVMTDKTYTKEEVRAALARSRKNGLNVSELLAEFGAENFTGLPAAKYPEVMARLEAL